MKRISPLLLATLSILAPAHATAFFGGPTSFEECMAAEMKDRQLSHQSIVKASCRKKFPAMPRFLSPSQRGVIKCGIPARAFEVEIDLQEKIITVASVVFSLQQRTREQLKAIRNDSESGEIFDKGTQLTVNFELGEATIATPGSQPMFLRLECYS